jgi:hypothetical protein
MVFKPNSAAPAALVLFLGLGQSACSPKTAGGEPAVAAQLELASLPKPTSSRVTPPITPSSTSAPRDTPLPARPSPAARPVPPPKALR